MSKDNITKEEFLNYIRAFNKRDYDKQHSFYHEKVELTIPDPAIGTLKGSNGIMEHYKPIHANADETVIPMVVMIDGNRIFFVMEAYFLYKNATDRAVHDYKVTPGDVLKITSWAIYDMEDKKMKTITCNLFAEELLGKVDVNEHIRDSEKRADPDVRL